MDYMKKMSSAFLLAEDLPEGFITLSQVAFCISAQPLSTEGNLHLLLNFYSRLKHIFALFIDLQTLVVVKP